MEPSQVYRATIRISLNGDAQSKLRAQLKANAFEPSKFINEKGAHGTGTWVRWGCTKEDMADCMTSIWSVLKGHKGAATIDHFWANFELVSLKELGNLGEWPTIRDELNKVGVGGGA